MVRPERFHSHFDIAITAKTGDPDELRMAFREDAFAAGRRHDIGTRAFRQGANFLGGVACTETGPDDKGLSCKKAAIIADGIWRASRKAYIPSGRFPCRN